MNELAITSEPKKRPTERGCRRRFDRIDMLLIALLVVGLVLLLAGLAWPELTAWVNRPRAGTQVPLRFEGPMEEDRPAVAIDYLLYLPQGYGREDRDWPLVVYLHGAGLRGTDLERIKRRGPPRMVAEGRAFPFVLVSPQCRADRRWEPPALLRLIDHVAAQYRVDADRVYVTGYSMGGFGTWDLAVAAPERFAAIAPLAGGGDELQANRLTNLPIWAFHGAVDQAVPLEAGQGMVDAVHAAGGEKVKLTLYENKGHGIAEATFTNAELWDWLLAQRRPGAGHAVIE